MEVPEGYVFYPTLKEINCVTKYNYLLTLKIKEKNTDKILQELWHYLTTNKELVTEEKIISSSIFNIKQYWIVLNEKQASANIYNNFIQNEKNEHQKAFYSFWIRKKYEEIIIILHQIYDKSFHILNCKYDLKYKKLKNNFNSKVLEKIKNDEEDNKYYEELKKIDREISAFGYRNNIIHNFSPLQVEYQKNNVKYAEKLDKIINNVNKINILIEKQIKIINLILNN